MLSSFYYQLNSIFNVIKEDLFKMLIFYFSINSLFDKLKLNSGYCVKIFILASNDKEV